MEQVTYRVLDAFGDVGGVDAGQVEDHISALPVRCQHGKAGGGESRAECRHRDTGAGTGVDRPQQRQIPHLFTSYIYKQFAQARPDGLTRVHRHRHPATAVWVLELDMRALLDNHRPAQPRECLDDFSSSNPR